MVSRILGMLMRRKMDPDCQEVRDISSDYIDGELNQAAEVRVKSHLEMCGPCTAFVNTLRATVRLLRSTPKRVAPSGLRQRIREALPTDTSE